MDREVKENYIINDIENVKTFIENLTEYEIDVEEMIGFINRKMDRILLFIYSTNQRTKR